MPPTLAINQSGVPFKIRLQQFLRYWLKRTVWESLTTLPKYLGHPLQSVQILIVDRPKQLILLLQTQEVKTGYTPIQGLRKWEAGFRYGQDVRLDAQRELQEEATPNLMPLESFQPLLCYQEGTRQQFDCRVFWLAVESENFQLLQENAEGLPLWVGFTEAKQVLNSTLAELLDRVHLW